MFEQILGWLIIMIVLLGIEMATMGLTTVWFAGGALFAILAALLRAPFGIQIVLFLLVALVLLLFTRPVAVKYFNKNRVQTNVASVIGKQAIVTAEIDNLHGKGQVTVGGQEWSARSAAADQVLAEGVVVRVVAVSGVKLIVEEVQPEKETESDNAAR